ncbi:MAG: L-arabinose isomerase [Actinomycetaceae bacterium]|nr:L-arabinose isomerase [Actinomycetaceae bacterium]
MSVLPSFDKLKVWFLVGSQGLYGEDTLRQVKEQSQQVCAMLNDSGDLPLSIEWRPVLTDSASIAEAMEQANVDPQVVGVIAWMHTFSPAKMWVRGLQLLQKPLLHFHTQTNVKLPYASLDFDFMNLNQSAHGDREFGYILTRLGVPRKSVVGHASDPRPRKEIASWMRAAVGLHTAKGMKVARFGDNMRQVAVTEGDKTAIESVLGVSVNTWPVNELVEVTQQVSDADVEELLHTYDEAYDVVSELRADGARRDSLRDSARIELGLRRFLTDGGFSAFTDTFEDLGGLKQLPGIAAQRLMADGYGFGAEGDWKTAILIHLAAAMGQGLPGGASLMEDYTYDLTPGQEIGLGAHMLEVSPTLTSKKPSLEIHPLDIGGREDPCRLVFTADPGPGVVAALSDIGPRFRLVVNEIELVSPAEDLPNLPVGRALWKASPDFVTATKCWLEAGAAHHTVLSNQLTTEVWTDFARMAGIELALIDNDTRFADFERNLRFEDMYRK